MCHSSLVNLSFGYTRHLSDDAKNEIELDAIAGFDARPHGLGSDSSDPDLAAVIVGHDVVQIERDLTVDANGLDPLQNGLA
jgi:hypothetical protein